MSTKDIFTTLVSITHCICDSDLLYLKPLQKQQLIIYLELKTEANDFSLKQWNEVLTYITDCPACNNRYEARDKLIEFLKK